MAETAGGADIVTLLFTDLVGSTELLETLGDDPAEAVRRSHFRLLRDVVAAHGGHEVKSLGDGLMVVFGSALDALRSAVTIQRAVSRHNRSGQGHPFAIRVGLHAGEPVRDGDDYFGTPVVVARRLCDAARGGQILASQLLVGLVGSRGAFGFRSVGPLALKGLADPVAAVEVAWAPQTEPAVGAADGRSGAAPCVGLRLLGPLEVAAGGAGTDGSPVRVVDIGSAKQRAVLAVLALHQNEVVSRDQLVDRLWGDRPPASATVTLRSLVSRLRKALDGADVGFEIVTREPGWTLRGEPGVVDASRFKAFTAEARLLLAGGDPPAAALTWRKALGLWRGAALVDVVDAGYLAGEATRLDEAHRDAVEDLVDAELASGWPAEALGRLEPHISSHPLRERAWGQLMVALYHLGRQAEALRAYQRLRALLREELGLDPTPALADLEARILRQDPSLAPPAAVAPSEGFTSTAVRPASHPGASSVVASPFVAGSPERTPFVGRVAELATLSSALERARAGSGGMLLIGGEPGIGKTRLAEEAVAEAAAAGMSVFVGHSYEIVGAAPYVAVVEILEAALAAAPSAEVFVADVLGDAAPEIARLLPQLRRRFPDLPAPLDLPPEQERLYLFRCLTDILARLAGNRPALIVFDDLQWADDATLLFVEHLAPRLAGLPLLVVATYRDTDVGRPLARTFGDLHRNHLAGRISLRALTPAEAGELVAGLAGQSPPAELVGALHAASDGNAFFLEEIVRDLAESGRAFDDTGRFRAAVDVGDLGLPKGVRLVIERRLDRLSEPARAALSAAAVSGRVFSVELLQALGSLGGDDALDIIDEAEQAVIIEASRNDDEFLFSHELIRQTLVAGLPGTRRRRLHARAAEALERIHATDVRAAAATIAHHLLEAGPAADPKRTFGYLRTAAEHAMETSAYEEAVRHLESALLLPDAASDRERAELLSQLGTARRANEQWFDAIEVWKEAVDAYEAFGDAEAAGRICYDAAYSLGVAARFDEARAWIERGIGLLGDAVNPTRAALLATLGSFLAADDDAPFEVGDGLIAQALAIAEDLEQPAVLGSCLLAKTTHRLFWMHRQEVAEAALEAADLLHRAGSSWEEAAVLGFAGYGLVGAGRFDEARAVAAYLEPLAERVGDTFLRMQARRTAHGMVGYAETGDLDALEAFAWSDLKLTADNGIPWVSNSHGWLGLAFFFKGDWDQARQHFETAAELEPAGGFRGWDLGLLFEFRAYAGERERALALLDDEDAPLPVPGRENGWGRWSMLLAAVEGLSVLGERDRAASYYDLVVECIERTRAICSGFQDSRLPQRTAGIAATAGRSWDNAETHFRTALRQAEELPHLPEQAHTRRFFARMLLERNGPGDRAAATRMATEATDLYRQMGMSRHAELAAGLLTVR